MLLATYLVLSSTVFPAYLSFPYPTQRFLFVDFGQTAQIRCTSAEKIEDGGLSFSWYKRRESRLPVLIKRCSDRKTGDRFVCRTEADSQNSVLKISNVQRHYNVSNGLYLLIVGDSYTPSTWVMLLKPSAQGPSSQLENQLACVVYGASNLVQISWDVPGDLPHEAWTLLAKNNSGSLTIVSLLRFPMELHSSGVNITCEVRFNSSRTSLKRIAMFNAWCHTEICEPPPSEAIQDGICYAQLNFQAKTQDERKRRPAGQGKKSKIVKDL
ncbi:uncharacterized protein LOC118076264 [Zootoca vivipara]|uniref:uncharacterized protein LOC118076264 n=1 Tax=Zootoca vivipara TaxID=8524 RepID=UPI00293BA3D9|nr:uncharacterized protein LOC118076264 [Zootoca vivipara]